MKQTLLLLILLISEPCFAGEYSDCILENMKGVATQSAVYQVKIACREKALPYVPAKCYSSDEKKSELLRLNYFNKYDSEYLVDKECIEKCLNASYWSKHFGDCKE